MLAMEFICRTTNDTKALGQALGRVVRGGEVIAFRSDLGGGKTTFVKGLAKGMGVTGVVQSPTFVISQIHSAERGLELHHFDFYRLNEPGIMRAELAESLAQPNAVVAIEWDDIVHDILPKDSLRVTLRAHKEDEARTISIVCPSKYDYIVKTLHTLSQYRI